VPGLLGLGMGTTLALFQQVGKYPSRRRWLKREGRMDECFAGEVT